MKKMLLGLIIGLLMITIPVHAQELHQYSAKIEILQDNKISYDVNLIFSNYASKTFSISLGGHPQNLLINTDIDCKTEETMFETEVVCNVDKTDFNINLKYEYDDKVEENAFFTYKDSLKVPLFTKELIVEVKIPEGTGLMNTTDGLSFTPKFGAFRSDGRNHYISWKRVGLSRDAVFDFSVAYERLFVNYSILFVPIVLVVAIVLSLMFYRFYLREGKMRVVLPVLKDDERKVVEAMMKHGNGVNQKAVVRDSGYSKAKVSKVLNSLQERGLIKLERLGRSNKIHFVGKLREET